MDFVEHDISGFYTERQSVINKLNTVSPRIKLDNKIPHRRDASLSEHGPLGKGTLADRVADQRRLLLDVQRCPRCLRRG